MSGSDCPSCLLYLPIHRGLAQKNEGVAASLQICSLILPTIIGVECASWQMSFYKRVRIRLYENRICRQNPAPLFREFVEQSLQRPDSPAQFRRIVNTRKSMVDMRPKTKILWFLALTLLSHLRLGCPIQSLQTIVPTTSKERLRRIPFDILSVFDHAVTEVCKSVESCKAKLQAIETCGS